MAPIQISPEGRLVLLMKCGEAPLAVGVQENQAAAPCDCPAEWMGFQRGWVPAWVGAPFPSSLEMDQTPWPRHSSGGGCVCGRDGGWPRGQGHSAPLEARALSDPLGRMRGALRLSSMPLRRSLRCQMPRGECGPDSVCTERPSAWRLVRTARGRPLPSRSLTVRGGGERAPSRADAEGG